MPAPAGSPDARYPLLAHHESAGWRVVVLAHPGLQRAAMEDAWAVDPAVRVPGGAALLCAAVFDGVGGLPHGREAAWAAAGALVPAVAAGVAGDRLLARLHEAVQATGGLTTAVVVLADAGREVRLFSVGDSSAYALDPSGALIHVVPHDVDADGLTACLGATPLRTQARTWAVAPGSSLLLCTDGVDKVAPPAAIAAALAAPPPRQEAAMRALLQAVLDGKAPDNLAAVLLHRRA